MKIHEKLNWLTGNLDFLEVSEGYSVLRIAEGLKGTGLLNDEDIKDYLYPRQIEKIKKLYEIYQKEVKEL